MVKRMKLPSIFRSRKAKAPWKWYLPFEPLKSISFRYKHNNMFKSPSSALSLSAMVDENGTGELLEMAVNKAVTSKRLFFEPAGESSSLLGSSASGFKFQDCVVQAVESEDPYIDFRKSMEEMIEAYNGFSRAGKRDWEYLEELLAWFLRMNRKKNHGFIVEAFIDAFAGLPSSSSSSCSFYCSANSDSSSKSKDWWEIEVESQCLKGKYPKYS